MKLISLKHATELFDKCLVDQFPHLLPVQTEPYQEALNCATEEEK